MERIRITSDSPGYIKVSDIGKDLRNFSRIIETKYSEIDFDFLFCFRALYSTVGIRSKVRYEKDVNMLGMDLIMSLYEFNPYKENVSMQRRIMGKHFFPFFSANIHKYIYKLPVLKSVEKELVEDMRLFLVENLWLPNENGQYRLSVIETSSYEHCIKLFGNPKEKKFADNEQVFTASMRWAASTTVKCRSNSLPRCCTGYSVSKPKTATASTLTSNAGKQSAIRIFSNKCRRG